MNCRQNHVNIFCINVSQNLSSFVFFIGTQIAKKTGNGIGIGAVCQCLYITKEAIKSERKCERETGRAVEQCEQTVLADAAIWYIFGSATIWR